MCVGGIMVAVSQADLSKAKREAKIAETNLEQATRRHNACSQKVADLEARVRQLDYERQQAEYSLDNITRETSHVYSLMQNIADVQPSFRYATTKLGEIAGGTNVLEVATRRPLVLLEPLMENLEDIARKMDQLSRTSGNNRHHLLLQRDIAPITRRLKENRAKLRAISYQRNQWSSLDQWT